MRVRIVFNLKNRGACLPFHHQSILSDFLKKTLIEGGNDQFLKYTFYNFSGIKGQTKVSKKGLHYLSQKVTIVLASPHNGFVDHVLKQVFLKESIELGELILHPSNVEIEEVPQFGQETKFISISPIVIVDPSLPHSNNPKSFIVPDNDLFSDLLYEITMQRMEKMGAYSKEQIATFFKFQVVPDKTYLEKVKQEEKKFARIYTVFNDQKKIEVRGYTLPFTLYAAPEVQQFLFDCGLGAFTNKGFGMIDLAVASLARNTQPYKF